MEIIHKKNHISSKITTKIVLQILTLLIYLKRGLFFIGKIIFKPLSKISSLLLHSIIFRIYKINKILSKRFGVFYTPMRDWAIAPFGSMAAVHTIIIAITFVGIANNINAQETRIDGTSIDLQKNIIYRLTADENFRIVEEKANTTNTKIVYSYLDEHEAKPYINRQERLASILSEDTSSLALNQNSGLAKPSLTSTQSNLQLRNKIENYTVENGDTLGGIAQKFGISLKTILWANNLSTRSYIKPGDTLKILPVNGLAHEVTRGQQLASIANLYDADIDKILEFNRLVDANDIQIGQELIIPDGTKPAPKPTYTTPSRTTTSSSSNNGPTRSTPSNINNSIIKSTDESFIAQPVDTPPPPVSTTALQWPTSWRIVTQYYSWKHTGLDIDGDYTTPIYASEAGTVIKAQGGWNGGYGTYIIIDHGDGMTTLYAHASKLFVSVGDQVTRGQSIAMVGTTGRSTGTHLHYEVRVNGSRVNPLTYTR